MVEIVQEWVQQTVSVGEGMRQVGTCNRSVASQHQYDSFQIQNEDSGSSSSRMTSTVHCTL